MLGSYGSQGFRLNTPFLTMGNLGQSALPAGHRHWSNYDAFVYDTRIKYGDDRFSNQVKFLNERLDFVKSKMYVQLNRLGQVSDSTVREGLRNKYDIVMSEIDAGEYAIRNTTEAGQLKGRFGILNDIWSEYDKLVNAIQILPGTVGLSVKPAEIREQALASMTEEERDMFEREGGSQWVTQLQNQLYQNKVIDVMKSFLGSEAVAPMEKVAEENTRVIKNSKPGIVETLSDKVPTFGKLLDAAESETFGSFFGKFFAKPAMFAGIAAAVIAGGFLAFKLAPRKRRPVTANPCGSKRRKK